MGQLISGKKDRRFVCYLHWIGLDNISLGVSINWHVPNLELHLPFCFVRVGWQCVYRNDGFQYRTFGREYRT